MHEDTHKHPKVTKRPTNNDFILEKNKIERQVYYFVGKSRSPILSAQIEKKVLNQNRTERATYVYDVIEKRSPDSDEFPSVPLFRYNEFFNKEGEIRKLGVEEIQKLEKKIGSRIFNCYNLTFRWKNEPKVKYVPKEKPEERGINIIEITISNKNDENAKDDIVITLYSDKSKENNFAKLFNYKIGLPIPIKIEHKKGDVYAYYIEHKDPNLKCYLDKLQLYIDKKNKQVSFSNNSFKDNSFNKMKSCYTLNLRGFLRYLILSQKTNRSPHKEINQVIVTLAYNDFNWSTQNEFQNFNNNGKISLDKQISFYENLFYKSKIQESFSFLKYYNQYKKYLRKNYAAKTLIEIANELENKLETMDIHKLKYEVTSRFFNEIEEYFWEQNVWKFDDIKNSKTRITDKDIIPDELLNILKRFQEENRYYIKVEKEKELKEYIEKTEYYKEQNYENELKRFILKFLDNVDKDGVSISEILKTGNIKTDIDNFWGIKLNVLEEICENERSDYMIAMKSGDFLIKRKKIEEVKETIKPEMTWKEVNEILNENELFADEVISALIKLSGYKIIKDMKTKQYIIKG